MPHLLTPGTSTVLDDLTGAAAAVPTALDPASDGRVQRTALGFARAFYTLYYGSGAFLSPFLALYFAGLGLDGRQVGVLRGIAPLITLVAAPLWGVVADASRRHKLIRMIALVGSWIAVLILSATRSYGVLVAVVAGFALFGAPVMPLIDSAVLKLLGDNKAKYGQQRLWGAVGWGVSGLVAGLMIERYGLSVAFVGYLVLMGCTVLMGLAIPSADRRLPTTVGSLGRKEGPPSERSNFGSDVRKLLLDRHWAVFLVALLAGGLYLAVEMNYLMVYMDELGASKTLMGIALTVSTISEIPVWALAPYFLKRWGPKKLLTVALAAGAVQSLAFSLLTSAWGILPLQMLHGLAFSAVWAAGVSYAADVAPAGTEATAQGMFGAVLMGLSAAIGAYIGGLLFASIGGALTFRVTVFTSLVALILLWVGGRDRGSVREIKPAQ